MRWLNEADIQQKRPGAAKPFSCSFYRRFLRQGGIDLYPLTRPEINGQREGC
jgi:hypothetical protein